MSENGGSIHHSLVSLDWTILTRDLPIFLASSVNSSTPFSSVAFPRKGCTTKRCRAYSVTLICTGAGPSTEFSPLKLVALWVRAQPVSKVARTSKTWCMWLILVLSQAYRRDRSRLLAVVGMVIGA